MLTYSLFPIIICILFNSLQVKSAEAEAEAKYLSGVGVAKQRKAIVDGLKTSIVVSCLSYPLTSMHCSIVCFCGI